MKKIFFLFLIGAYPLVVFTQSPKEKGFYAITEDVVEAQLEFLSSDWTEGRATATRGAYMSADYIASMFRVYGLKPGGDEIVEPLSRRERMEGKSPVKKTTYFQTFPLIKYTAGENQYLSIVSTGKESRSVLNLGYHTDFSVSPGPVSVEGSAPVVFAGYGYYNEDKGYDDFKKVNVNGTIILRLAGFPGHKDSASLGFGKFNPKDRYARYYMSREKNKYAAEKGVLAIIEIDPEWDYNNYASNIPFRYNTPLYEGESRLASYYDHRMTMPGDSLDTTPPVFYISMRMALELLDGSGISISEFEKKMAAEPVPHSKLLKGKNVDFKTTVNSEVVQARNVVGVIEGISKDEIIVVGGHYDHLGMHDGYIWNGADDNASGTVGVMTIAKACMATGKKPDKTIVFAAWTGEEKGLWGSKYFVDHPYDDRKIILNLNYDMISRDNADDTLGVKCSMSYTRAFAQLEIHSKDNVDAFDLNLDVSYRGAENASGGSDHAPFAAKEIPYFYFMAGFPPEYHQSNDHIELVNIKKMTDIIRLGYLNIYDFANSDKWRKP